MRQALRQPWRNVVAHVATLLILVFCLLPVDAMRQAEAPAASQVPSGVDLDRLVARFIAASDDYGKTFRNLVAEETKLIEVFSASGEVEKRREIVSDLVVYHSSRHGSEATTEYRDVRTVDGKAVKDRGERAVKLLMNASRAESLEQELKAIDRETVRYEFRKHIRGSTINQTNIFKRQRDLAHVEWVGRDKIGDHDVVALDYRQTAPIPGSRSSLPLPREFGTPSPLSRGRLWLDATTAQLWRSVWEVVVTHPRSPDPLVMLRTETTYGPSRFDILVPQHIVFDWLTRFSHPKNGRPSFTLAERTTFTYGSFRRFEVSTDENVALPEPSDR